MNRLEIITSIMKQTGHSKKETEAFICAFTNVVEDALKTQDKVLLKGFGRFETARRNERIRRDPKSGQIIHCPAKTVPIFRPAKKLNLVVNTGQEK